ncbi:MAG: hypothetical protein JWL73_1171 [Actinomycetia bacterium]|nr:hypothetical protein [Actinomycetes bacterium]
MRTTVASLLAVVLAGVVMYGCGGASGGSAPARAGALSARIARTTRASAPFGGLTATRVRIGDQCLHVVVADTEAEQEEGLRARADLGGYDAMLFRFPGPTTTAFTMSGTLVPLTIGFYDAAGRRIDGFRMTPCPGDDAGCPVYRARDPFRYAIETTAERLPAGALVPCG